MNFTKDSIINNRYRILELLGEGGFAKVYSAFDEQLSRKVALKILHAGLDNDSWQRFQREAKILAGLRHQNLASIYSLEMIGENLCIVMEYINGKTLSKIITEKISIDFAENIFRQICNCINYLHENGVLHRDISTQNILITCDSTVKVIDLGLAWIMELDPEFSGRLTRTGFILGNPNYLSPECCRGERATKLSDIYSLGCVAYELFTERVPFDAENSIALLYKQQHEYPASPMEVLVRRGCKNSEKISQLVLHCLQKQCQARMQSCAGILKVLNAQSSHVEKSDLEGWAIAGSADQKRPTNLPVFGIGVLLVSIILALTTSITGSSRHKEQTVISPESSKTSSIEKDLLQVDNYLEDAAHLSEAGQRSSAARSLRKALKLFAEVSISSNDTPISLARIEKSVDKIIPLAPLLDVDDPIYKTLNSLIIYKHSGEEFNAYPWGVIRLLTATKGFVSLQVTSQTELFTKLLYFPCDWAGDRLSIKYAEELLAKTYPPSSAALFEETYLPLMKIVADRRAQQTLNKGMQEFWKQKAVTLYQIQNMLLSNSSLEPRPKATMLKLLGDLLASVNSDKAEECLKTALSLNQLDALMIHDLIRSYAELCEKKGQYEKAIELYQEFSQMPCSNDRELEAAGEQILVLKKRLSRR
ncbi:MAG: serine/threonine protein kinase [Candidatus Obscuribacterales bacterium]|nr:serine/threonine protein kinase [Candidatus Obscuribacterales bacterium]